MEIKSFWYSKKAGWSGAFPVNMDSERTLLLLFGASEYLSDPGPIAELARAFPKASKLGCSTSGEIAGSKVMDGSLSVAVAKFDATSLRVCTTKVASAGESFAAGQEVAKGLNLEGLKAVVLLSDGLGVNGSELVRGMNSVLPESVVVTGGLAGDGDRFKQTWILDGTVPRSGMLSAVGFYGEHVRIGHGSKGGWDKFGPERLVTASNGNVLKELDGKPALALYKEYLGERASGLPATGLLFPLAIRESRTDDKILVRTILAVNEAEQSMTFAGDIPKGCLAQLMKANFDRLIGGANEAALMAKNTSEVAKVSPTLAIAISCVGRRLVLGERTEEELEAALDVLPPDTTQVGFYSYGEISPYATGRCDLHNQTMTLTAIREV